MFVLDLHQELGYMFFYYQYALTNALTIVLTENDNMFTELPIEKAECVSNPMP